MISLPIDLTEQGIIQYNCSIWLFCIVGICFVLYPLCLHSRHRADSDGLEHNAPALPVGRRLIDGGWIHIGEGLHGW